MKHPHQSRTLATMLPKLLSVDLSVGEAKTSR